MKTAGFGSTEDTVLPDEIIKAVEDCGFFESIPLWAVTLIGGLFITVLSFIMIMSVYGRFFRLYLYTAIAPIPLSSFAGEPSQNIGRSFLKSYAAVCLEGAIVVLACIIFFIICIITASSRSRCSCSHYGVELYWRIDFQYACTGRGSENVRPSSAGNDGIVKRTPESVLKNHSIISPLLLYRIFP